MHLKGENFIIDAVQQHFQLHHVIHRDARDGDLHASAGMVIPSRPGIHKPGMCMWRCCLDVTLALAIRATVKGPDRCEWSRLESWVVGVTSWCTFRCTIAYTNCWVDLHDK